MEFAIDAITAKAVLVALVVLCACLTGAVLVDAVLCRGPRPVPGAAVAAGRMVASAADASSASAPTAQSSPPPRDMSWRKTQERTPEIVQQQCSVDPLIHWTGDHYAVSRDLYKRLTKPSLELVPHAQIVPSIRDGKARGFKCWAVPRCSLLERLGFKDGDLFISINDTDISTPEKALSAYKNLRQVEHYSVLIERQGIRMKLRYRIHGPSSIGAAKQ
ncbi:MAG: hypothetical protein JNJ46_07525 [Myxococcales bacterium]|nr:hypothetical protein [Myxococcales bacterium]